MNSKIKLTALIFVFLTALIGARDVCAETDFSKIIEFHDSLTVDSTSPHPVKSWKEEEKTKVLEYFRIAHARFPGVLERAALYGPMLAYRVEKAGTEHIATAFARVYDDQEFYFSDFFFRSGVNHRGIDFQLWTFAHELAHLADSGYKVEYSPDWIRIVTPISLRVQSRLNAAHLTPLAAFQAERHDIALAERMPSLYCVWSRREALAEYTAAMALDEKFEPPADVKAFLETRMFSRPISKETSIPHAKAGFKYLQKREYPKAIAEFDEAIRLDSKYIEAYYGRGRAYSGSNNPDRAMTDYSQVILFLGEDDPDRISSLILRGEAKIKKSDLDGAIQDLTEAIRLNAQNAGAFYFRGIAYVLKQDYSKGISDLIMTIKLNPSMKESATQWIQKAEAGKKL